MNIGNFALGATIDKKFSTRTASGTPITFAGSPALAVYKDNNTAEVTTGLTLTVDFDGRAGLHHVRIVTSDAFYVAGNYEVVVTSGTVDGVSVVNESVFSFSLEARHPAPNDVADATLKRDWSLLTGEASRSMLNALRFIRNKWSISGTTLTVKKENDSTDAWTAVVTPATGGDPVSGIDPP